MCNIPGVSCFLLPSQIVSKLKYLKNIKCFLVVVVLNIIIEFWAIPIKWLEFFTSANVLEIWVPSEYGRSALVANGVSVERIHVVPHGVYTDRYEELTRAVSPLALPTKKRFKFLFNAGLCARKGIDVLLDAYNRTFRRHDDVSLVVHSIYKCQLSDELVKRVQRGPDAPDIVYSTHALGEIDMLRLYKSVNAYVTPYRSEGFGLTILEAMASGVPVVVTRYGPSLDFCSPSAVFFVNASETECHAPPCGTKSVFALETKFQPRWSEPDVNALGKVMLAAYTNPWLLARKATAATHIARNYTWTAVIDAVSARLAHLVDKYEATKTTSTTTTIKERQK